MLVLVVGPSGAGKDTLMAAARLRLEGDPRFRFVQRDIFGASGAAHAICVRWPAIRGQVIGTRFPTGGIVYVCIHGTEVVRCAKRACNLVAL